jgi:hypothetical protein
MSAWITIDPVTSCPANDGSFFIPILCDSLWNTLPTQILRSSCLRRWYEPRDAWTFPRLFQPLGCCLLEHVQQQQNMFRNFPALSCALVRARLFYVCVSRSHSPAEFTAIVCLVLYKKQQNIYSSVYTERQWKMRFYKWNAWLCKMFMNFTLKNI